MEPRPTGQTDFHSPEVAEHDSPNPDLNKVDWTDPASILRACGTGPGALHPSKIEDPSQVCQEATERSNRIFTSFATLNAILERHEHTIRKRWAKRTRQQRLKILRNAWPNMAAVHRPDFEAFRKESEADRERGTKHRDAFMWPHINQENLSTPKTFPLLLNARGRYPPSNFAAADLKAMHLGLVTKGLVAIFLDGHVMILNGLTENTMDYSKVMAWNKHLDALEWITTQKQFTPGEGLLILEA